ncbi:MAG TPA: quinone oxidoreductase [Dongiaceae bacterium]|nr:quinone oxidoreductase [Dongiaceae bacterium]
MRAIRVHEIGGAEKLRLDEVPVPEPKSGEVRIKVEAAGVNFIDTYQRSGLYPLPLPFTLGMEVAGTVSAVGADVLGCNLGDRVASARASGGYADEAIVPAAQLVHLPDGVGSQQAAALLLQGLTAHYLACDTHALRPGESALVHAAAGGVGLLLVQIAKRRGARVIGTVGSEEKARLAREAGADEVVIYTRDDFAAAARRFTGGRGVDVVYDGVGRDTFEGSLNSLRPRGLLACFGNSSGPVAPFAPLLLSQRGSLYITRPTLANYTQTTAELRRRTDDLFRWLAAGVLRVRIGATFQLAEAAEGQRALEGRRTTGKVLLLIR